MEVEVPVESYDDTALPMEHGVAGWPVLQRQAQSAAQILDAYQPERVVVFGGIAWCPRRPLPT